MSDTDPRILFWGTESAFSVPPLAALLDAGLPVVGVVTPARPVRGTSVPPSPLPMLEPEGATGIRRLARERAIPLYGAGDPDDPALLTALTATRPDFICVACFPRRLPAAILALPRVACVNVHPSLLPRHRGPAPLFWAFRDGDTETGVTIHIMDDRIDSGDILLQKSIPIPNEIAGSALESICATEGGALLVDAVRGLAEGSLARRPQNEAEASYEGWPTAGDLVLSPTWSAQRARNFIRGVGEWYPVRC